MKCVDCNQRDVVLYSRCRPCYSKYKAKQERDEKVRGLHPAISKRGENQTQPATPEQLKLF